MIRPGIDGLSVTAGSLVFEVAGDAPVSESRVTPEDAGLPRHSLASRA
jgi:hypothetical protein